MMARCAGFAGLLLLIGLAGCQRAGMEPPEPPTPPGVADATEPTPDRALQPPSDPYRPLRTGTLPTPAVEVEGVDAILHARAGQDPHQQERIAFWIDFWTSRSRDHFQRYLERMGHYDHFVDRELEERGLPRSLRYLPIVESGYHFGVTSRAGATGLWQLMSPTARGLGLHVDALVDDRRDPVGSTTAALDYLTELHGQFGSWFLALAAYNAGPGRIGRLLAIHAPDTAMPGDERYLLAHRHFPAETREFVPRFFAAAALASDPERYGFVPPDRSDPLVFDEVVVPDATSLDVIARAAEADEDEVVALNPQYLRGFTPVGAERTVRVPEGTGDRFEENFALIPPSERISFLEHVVARGETLSHVARRYGISLNELTAANGGLDPRRLQIGQRLVVPVAGASAAGTTVATAGDAATGAAAAGAAATGGGAAAGAANAASSAAEPSGSSGPSDGAAARHLVRQGESLWSISRRHGVGVDDLRRWNGLTERSTLQPGQDLVVGPGARLHRVQRGETWSGIARRYGVSTAALARANGRTTRDIIRAGEELRIP